MNKPTKIITHHGQAHRDEFLAVALILAYFEDSNVPVERRDPAPEELDDPDIWVVDVGGRHEPELRNFDHHQFPRDMEPTCALTLVLDHLELRETFKAIYGWLPLTERLDVQGPAAAAAVLGMSVEAFFKTLSPVEKALLDIWADAPATVAPVLTQIGTQLLDHAAAYVERLSYLHENAQVIQVPGEDYYFVFLPRPEGDQLSDPSLAMREFRAKAEQDIAVSVAPDPRGEGYGLFRFDDDVRVDFSELKDHPDVEFAHVGGFYATTPVRELDRLAKLVAEGCS
jgi:hypothetical protein